MNSGLEPTGDSETARVEQVYRRYGVDPGRQRAWSAENPGNQMIREELVAAMFRATGSELRRARAILDVGCGTGWWLGRLAAERTVGAELYGIDVLPERVDAARLRVPGARVETADARHLPLADGEADVVTLLTVLSSLAGVADAARAVDEALRVLAPAGVLLVWEPRWPNPANRATIRIRPQLVNRAAGAEPINALTLTLFPPLARRLGTQAAQLYPRLARVPILRSHRLLVIRRAR